MDKRTAALKTEGSTMSLSAFTSKKGIFITLLSLGPTFCVVDYHLHVTYIQQEATDDPAIVQGHKDNLKEIQRIQAMGDGQ